MTTNMSLGYLMAVAQRSMLETSEGQRALAKDGEDDAFRAAITKEREAAHAEHEKALGDYYVSNVESVGKMVPLVGDAVAMAVTSGKEDVWLAGPVYAGYGVAREGLRAEKARAEASGGEDPALSNPIARTMIYADRSATIERNDEATRARTDAKVLEKASSDAKAQRSEAEDLRRQTLGDARSTIEELRRVSQAIGRV